MIGMTRLIDADKVNATIDRFIGYLDEDMILRIKMKISAIPTVEQPHGECRTCKHFVIGGVYGKAYVCEHPELDKDDDYIYACINMEANDFCSRYEKEGGDPE